MIVTFLKKTLLMAGVLVVLSVVEDAEASAMRAASPFIIGSSQDPVPLTLPFGGCGGRPTRLCQGIEMSRFLNFGDRLRDGRHVSGFAVNDAVDEPKFRGASGDEAPKNELRLKQQVENRVRP